MNIYHIYKSALHHDTGHVEVDEHVARVDADHVPWLDVRMRNTLAVQPRDAVGQLPVNGNGSPITPKSLS